MRLPFPVFIPLLFVFFVGGLALTGCEQETREKTKEKARELVEEGKEKLEVAKEKGKEGLEVAKEKTRDGIELVKEKGKEGIETVKEKGKEAIDTLRPEEDEPKEEVEEEGSLSSDTLQSLKDHARSAGDHVAGWVAQGKQITHATVEIGKVLVHAIDFDVNFDPIYQDAGDEQAQANLDKSIASMFKLEVIDGVTVGFERVRALEKMKYRTGAGYLVLWRRGDKLIGFVWRSRREVDVLVLISEAPRLMGLIHEVIDGKK